MKILTETEKGEFLDALEALEKLIPVLDMDDRDFTATILYRMARIVREHGASHGVSLFSPGTYVRMGRTNGKSLYEAELWAAIQEEADRKKAAAKFKIGEADIDRVIYNPPATIVYWKDGTKTVVKCSDKDFDAGRMDPETGIVYAIVKKVLGNKGNYNDVLRRIVKGARKG